MSAEGGNVEELARRAVACRQWRWMPGMRILRPANEERRLPMRIVQSGVQQSVTNTRVGDVGFIAAHEPPGAAWCGGYERDDVPDLDDPATLGCLLALVREAWCAPRAMVRIRSYPKPADYNVFDVDRIAPNGGNWAAWLAENAPTEAAALVAALESAP